MSPRTTNFTPTPDQAAEILSELGNPDRTLRDIADEHATTVEVLSLWMTTPEIAERLAALHNAAVHRTRFIALTYLPSAVSTLNRIIDDYTDQLTRVPRPSSEIPRRRAPPPHHRRRPQGRRPPHQPHPTRADTSQQRPSAPSPAKRERQLCTKCKAR